jgi:hypothetical protein
MHFTHELETLFRPYLASHLSGLTQTPHVAAPPLREKLCKFGGNRAVTKGTLLLRPEEFFVPTSPGVAAA